MATARRLSSSESGAVADWVASSSRDLSLGFNAGVGGGGGGGGGGMWSSSSNSRQIYYGLPPEMGMVGLRGDVFVVAPASFHQHQEATINFDPQSINGGGSTAAATTTLGVGVIPLLTTAAAPCLNSNVVDEDLLHNNNRSSRGVGGAPIQLWQSQQHSQSSNFFKKPAILDHSGGSNMLHEGGGNGTSASTTTTTTCQDCGNQAKRDCSHRRCRTCCKSRGFDCSTHVKSTWVPAARRREQRHLLVTNVGAGAGAANVTERSSTQSISSTKKPKLGVTCQTPTASHISTSDTGSSMNQQDASLKEESLPGQVRAPAVFKCVRVTAVEDGEDEYAYQAIVKIGGHVFKGFLYDQGAGVEGRERFPDISDLHLGGGGNNCGGRNGASSSSPNILEPSDVNFAVSVGGGLLVGSSSYGNPIS